MASSRTGAAHLSWNEDLFRILSKLTGLFGLSRLNKALGGVHQKHQKQNRESKLSFLESAVFEFQSLILKLPFGIVSS